jgi:hypothetical protein
MTWLRAEWASRLALVALSPWLPAVEAEPVWRSSIRASVALDLAPPRTVVV